MGILVRAQIDTAIAQTYSCTRSCEGMGCNSSKSLETQAPPNLLAAKNKSRLSVEVKNEESMLVSKNKSRLSVELRNENVAVEATHTARCSVVSGSSDSQDDDGPVSPG